MIENSEIEDLVLIHDAYMKMKEKIDEGDVILKTILMNETNSGEEIEFSVRSIYETFKVDDLNNFRDRLPFKKHFDKQKIPSKLIKFSKQVQSIQECYLSCRHRDCEFFNICSERSSSSSYHCELSEDINYDQLREELEIDNKCDVFKKKNSNLFDKYEEKHFVSDPLDQFVVTDIEECTTKCLNRNDDRCKSVVLCDQTTCLLSEEHMENKLNKVDDNKNCTIYSGILVIKISITMILTISSLFFDNQ